MKKQNIPIGKKYGLTITEAAAYFGIGEKKLRRLIEDNPQAKWFIQNGVKYVIKRGLFEAYLNEISSI